MSQEAHTATAIFTTFSGVIGGVAKAVSAKPVLLYISFGALGTVVLYASASAAAGYLVKKVLDKFFENLAAYKEKRKTSTNPSPKYLLFSFTTPPKKANSKA